MRRHNKEATKNDVQKKVSLKVDKIHTKIYYISFTQNNFRPVYDSLRTANAAATYMNTFEAGLIGPLITFRNIITIKCVRELKMSVCSVCIKNLAR